jgi:uncharacterized membrane protein YwaF
MNKKTIEISITKVYLAISFVEAIWILALFALTVIQNTNALIAFGVLLLYTNLKKNEMMIMNDA